MRVSLVILAGMTLTGAALAATQRATPAQEASIRKFWNGCPFRDESLRDPELDRRRETDRQLRATFATGPGDPLGDARRAVASNDFRLFWSSSLAGPAVVGASCRFPQNHPALLSTPFTRGTYSVSDVVGECATVTDGCKIQERFRAYALAYNRAILADRAFPYPDLCTTEPGLQHSPQPMLNDPGSLAAPERIETDRPRTLAEAARRGTMSSVSRWIARTAPADLDRPDDFALTPLAWAVIEGRTEVARLLIANGADPLASCAPIRGQGDTLPLKIAMRLGRTNIIALMLRPDVERRLQPWPRPLIEAAVQGNQIGLVERMFREDHERVSMQLLMRDANKNGSAGMIAVLAGAQADAPDAMLATAIQTDNLSLLRDALGRKASVVAKARARNSPLGSAVMSGSPVTDQMVTLLLDAGAPVDSPAQWSLHGHPTGSSPATALAALVATARRFRSDKLSYKSGGEVEAQDRALDMLLEAGASPRAADERGRPLVVLAVLGQFDGITRDEPPPGWITRLARAGMDVNATWQDMTALDWLNRMKMGDTRTARELQTLGGKTSADLKTPALSKHAQ